MDLTSNWTTIGTFVCAFLGFHLWFMRFWKLSKRQVKKLDYWWLGFTSLGLITATGQLRQLKTSWEIPRLESHVDFSSQFNRRSIRTSLQYVSLLDVPNDYSPPNIDEINRERLMLRSWMEQLYTGLPDSAAREGYIAYRATLSLPALRDSSHKREAQEVLDNVDDIALNEGHLAAAKIKAEPSDLELALQFFTPVLFALALALRFTKVTLELRDGTTGQSALK